MTGQNRSAAVMQQRHEPHDSLDDFPTPPWATRALCEFLLLSGEPIDHCVVREPAANRGYMVRALDDYFAAIEASDIHDYGAGFPTDDYLFGFDPPTVDWTITNPPFRLAEQFIERATRTSRHGFAMLVRTSFVEGVGRYERLFSTNPPSIVAQFVERVPMVKGRCDPGASTATSYCWLIWIDGEDGTRFEWIAPCRKRLERPSDYLEQPPASDVSEAA
ncbi:hypothetical protein [Sphingopyxis sp. 113P3]|uniref:hypothetical protein n=1 Tax=Sphingopyxis sp. (strain 113P3) TaxID=292913 RepID=UPI0006AD11C9|nr:hypothetical protein [Sphingopyxis sp. 113P3]ALC13815.1 methyltransferase [Sphingopyxis sp. 113P3]